VDAPVAAFEVLGATAAPPATGAAAQMEAPSHRPHEVLMLCGLLGLPYRALRCVAAAGARVHVLGNAGARGLRQSRFCASFTPLDRPLDGSFDAALAAQVNAHVARLGIDMVMAGDQPSSRTLAGLRPLLRTACYPMPDLETFDLLNNKWAFYQLCQRLDVRCPPTVLLPDANAVAREIAAGRLAMPLIAKPLSLDGARGLVRLEGGDPTAALAGIRYAPVLVQRFVGGADIGASAYCRHGDIRAFVVHRVSRATYRTFPHALILESIRRIVAETDYTGVCNFDMRLAPDGTVSFLECNARFFYKMNLSMLAGVNFAAYGLDAELAANFVSGTQVRMEKAVLFTLATAPWRLGRRDLAFLVHRYGDPLIHLRELLGIDREGRTY
jgi:hypothetical protein